MLIFIGLLLIAGNALHRSGWTAERVLTAIREFCSDDLVAEGASFPGVPEAIAIATETDEPAPSPTASVTPTDPTVTASATARTRSTLPPPTITTTSHSGEYERIESPVPTPSPTPPPTAIPIPSPVVVEPRPQREVPQRLVIPAIGVDAPVVYVPLANQTWDLSSIEYEIAHLGGTAYPGEGSNVVLAGHVTLVGRRLGPFIHLEALSQGDMIEVHTDRHLRQFRVTETRVVPPTDVSVVYGTETSILTLITCTTWDANTRSYLERVVVVAEEIEPAP
ncbi:MAG TPA: class F sortase [Chloroflexi bacterium]|nr:class F sortase [Chloroflexota bacterium]